MHQLHGDAQWRRDIARQCKCVCAIAHHRPTLPRLVRLRVLVRTIAIEADSVQRRVSLAITFTAHRLLLLLLLQRRIHRYVILFTLKRTRTATIDRLQHRHHTAPFDSAASDAP